MRWPNEPQNYSYIHQWLGRTYGKADHCENPKCESTSTRFEWAKLTDKPYARKRENFWQLCKKCHVVYDGVSVGGWNKDNYITHSKVCPQCGNKFEHHRKRVVYCTPSCSSKAKAVNGGLNKAWATRRLKLKEIE